MFKKQSKIDIRPDKIDRNLILVGWIWSTPFFSFLIYTGMTILVTKIKPWNFNIPVKVTATNAKKSLWPDHKNARGHQHNDSTCFHYNNCQYNLYWHEWYKFNGGLVFTHYA